MQTIATENGFTIQTSFGSSILEGSLDGRAEGNGLPFAISIIQDGLAYYTVYVVVSPITGQTADFWDTFWSNLVGGEPADQFALSNFVSVMPSGQFSVALNADSFQEADEQFSINVYLGVTDHYFGVSPLVSATFTILDDDLNGTGNADSIAGRERSEYMRGYAGNDTLSGGDGGDTISGGFGDDFLFGGATEADLRDIIYGGDGNDSVEGGYGNDELRGDAGDDTLAGGFGSDTVIGGIGNDIMTGSAIGDLIYGGEGNDFINGGFGFDRLSGGAGSDRFYHLGVRDHGSDWIQDYSPADGDVLMFGGPTAANPTDFLVQRGFTPNAGQAAIQEVFITYRLNSQILWALIDGAAQSHLNVQIGGQVYDLLS